MKLMCALFISLFINASFADSEKLNEGGIHTPNYCSTTSAKSCAHLRFEEYPTTSKESIFLAHILPSNAETIISEIKVTLWMDMGNGHGHSSAPVVITPADEENHFNIQNGWFVMRGEWQVILSFKDNGADQKIIIPITIKE